MTPKLSDFEGQDNIAIKKEIVGGQEFTIVSYIFNDPELWKNPVNYEARGITFDADGNIVSRPLEKFHNLGENQYTQFKDLDFTDAEYFEKIDGSMISSIVIGGKVYFKTKKSFYSDVAQSCQKDFGDDERYIDFCTFWYTQGVTPIFEYTSPMNRIVVDYGSEPKLTLLALRCNVTGYYLPRFMLTECYYDYGIPVVEQFDINSIQDILSQDIENREGYVIRLKSGQRVKVKFPNYLLKHHTLDRMTVRNIAEMVIEECIDDFKALVDPRHLPKIEEIEIRVVKELEGHEICVQVLLDEWKDLTLPEIGKKYSSHPHFNCAIMVHKGKDMAEMVKRHYISKILPTLDNKQLW